MYIRLAVTLLLSKMQKLLAEENPDYAHPFNNIWQGYLLVFIETHPAAAIPYSNLFSSDNYGFTNVDPKLTQTPPTGYELVSLQTHIPIFVL